MLSEKARVARVCPSGPCTLVFEPNARSQASGYIRFIFPYTTDKENGVWVWKLADSASVPTGPKMGTTNCGRALGSFSIEMPPIRISCIGAPTSHVLHLTTWSVSWPTRRCGSLRIGAQLLAAVQVLIDQHQPIVALRMHLSHRVIESRHRFISAKPERVIRMRR